MINKRIEKQATSNKQQATSDKQQYKCKDLNIFFKTKV
jgi:hypothetical protein